MSFFKVFSLPSFEIAADDTGAHIHLLSQACFMNAKRILLNVVVVSTVLFSGARQAFAQEDESWYKQRLQGQRQVKLSPSPRVQQKSITTANQRTSCDFVINGDIETQVQPPSKTGNMGPFAWGNAPGELADWYSPTLGSPDYLATNAVNTVAGNDVNPNLEFRLDGAPTVSGSSTPHSGSGEIGLYSRQAYMDTNGNVLDRVSEYATVKLVSTLIDVDYYAEMWVSLSHSTLACNYGIDTGFGMWFTPNNSFQNIQGRDFLPQPTSQFISNKSPIDQNVINNGVLGATTWQRVSGMIRGNGASYVTIGAFNPNIKQQALPGKDPNRPNTYVFVDDFQLYRLPTAGASVSICPGSSATLGEGCAIPGSTYTWSAPGVTGLPTNSPYIQVTVSPTTTTTYTLTVNLPDNTTSVSRATVIVYPTITSAPDINLASWGQPAPGQGVYEYDVRVNNVGADSYTLHTEISQGNGGWTPLGYAYNSYNAYTGPDNPSSNELQGFTTFHMRLPGPVAPPRGGASTGPGNTFRFTVTANGSCNSMVAQKIITIPPYGGEGEESSRTALGSNTEDSNIAGAYPNPAAESLTLPASTESATLVNDQGKAVKSANKTGKLDVQSLPEGLYNLRMIQQGKVINQHIQVKH